MHMAKAISGASSVRVRDLRLLSARFAKKKIHLLYTSSYLDH